MSLDLIETLSRLVAIPSVNPMGGSATGDEFGEARLTDHLETLFDQLGLRHQRQTVTAGRENIIARLDGQVPASDGGRLLLLDAHQDTVQVDGMTIEPWTPTVRDGRLYGRGACDTKGGMAAMLWALARLAEERPPRMPTIVMTCPVDEESGFSGVRRIADLWQDAAGRQTGPDSIIPRKPDAAIVAEPTSLDVVVAHKGVVRWRCHTHGRAAHSADPSAGDNAIYKMARVLLGFQRYAEQVVGEVSTHDLCGSPTLSVGTIHGGAGINTVPELCTIEIDRRLLPNEDPEEAYRHVIDYLAGQPEIDFPIDHDPPLIAGLMLSDESNGELAERLAATAQEVTGHCRRVGVSYGTHAALFSAAGVPTVVFGPGSIEQAHTKDEWLPLDELEQAAEIIYRFCRE